MFFLSDKNPLDPSVLTFQNAAMSVRIEEYKHEINALNQRIESTNAKQSAFDKIISTVNKQWDLVRIQRIPKSFQISVSIKFWRAPETNGFVPVERQLEHVYDSDWQRRPSAAIKPRTEGIIR